LRESKLAELTALHQARAASINSTLENKKAKTEEPPPSHSTMMQQGKNPGKSSSQETKAQRKERLLKARADCFGDLPKPPVKPSISKDNAESVSKTKLAQIKKSPAFAREHSDLAEKMQRKEESKKLVQQLAPLFELGRKFPGRLDFEAQFGQVLISQTPQISGSTLHSQESWAAIFDPAKNGKSPSPSSFSRIMTTNGADIDRALEMRLPSGNTKVKVWSAAPGPSAVTYEFSCRSRSSEDFLIAIDQKGHYQLHKGSLTTGMINIHIPNQVWDASFVLIGSLNWLDAPELLTKSVRTFVDSLHVLPGREKLKMVFRQPSDHEIEIRNLVVRRVSFHRCNLLGHEELQLKITEVKSLLFKKHSQDNNLWQAYENLHDDYKKLMQDGRVHYEMSLIHTGINDALTQNESLEIGELTHAETSGKSLLKLETINLMLDLVVQMANRLDYMGMSNIGTLYRNLLQEQERQRNFGEMLGTVAPPGTVKQMPIQSASRVTPPSNDNVPIHGVPIHGVRSNTVAEIITNPDGSRYYRGLGGAKIPVPDDYPVGSDRSLGPEDSATQAGDHRLPAPTAHRGFRSTPPLAAAAAAPGSGSSGDSSRRTVTSRPQFFHPSDVSGAVNRGSGFW